MSLSEIEAKLGYSRLGGSGAADWFAADLCFIAFRIRIITFLVSPPGQLRGGGRGGIRFRKSPLDPQSAKMIQFARFG